MIALKAVPQKQIPYGGFRLRRQNVLISARIKQYRSAGCVMRVDSDLGSDTVPHAKRLQSRARQAPSLPPHRCQDSTSLIFYLPPSRIELSAPLVYFHSVCVGISIEVYDRMKSHQVYSFTVIRRVGRFIWSGGGLSWTVSLSAFDHIALVRKAPSSLITPTHIY